MTVHPLNRSFKRNAAFLSFILCLMSLQSHAQSVSIKDIPTSEESTTVEIKKGSSAAGTMKKEYKIVEENSEVAGEAAPLMKAARENWKKACDDWKKEIKSLNTDNKVISLNCGKAQCQTTSMETTCSSDGKAKIRVLITE